MGTIGRNDLCPCGSGKKYKKCCMGKVEEAVLKKKSELVDDFKNNLDSSWSYDVVREMNTAEIIERLYEFGIVFNENEFLRDTEKFYSGAEIGEKWFSIFSVHAEDYDEEFPIIAASILWERLVPSPILSMEQMSDLIDKGFEYLAENDAVSACDHWFKVWEAMKYRHNPEFKNLEFLDKQYNRSFFVSNFCQDLESELHNAGEEDKAYFEKRIDYCREFLNYFPNEQELIIHNMRRSIAESYLYLNNYEQAEVEYTNLVQDYPENPWGYIGWGDMYFFEKNKDYVKAKYLYEKSLDVAKDKEDRKIIQERLIDLEQAVKNDE